MDVHFVPLDLARMDALRYELVVLPFFEDERPLRGAAGLCDWRLCGRLSRWITQGRITGRAGEVTLVPGRPRLAFDKLLLAGAGASAGFDAAEAQRLTARVLDTLTGLRLRSFACSLPGRGTGRLPAGEAARVFLQCLGDPMDLDEVAIVDDVEAQRQMAPVIESERRRVRLVREARTG